MKEQKASYKKEHTKRKEMSAGEKNKRGRRGIEDKGEDRRGRG